MNETGAVSQQKPLRLLAVQTTSRPTSEVQVLHTLLDHLSHLASSASQPVDVLLVQGIDHHAGREAGHCTASLFSHMPNVTVHELPMGWLGQHDTPRFNRALKVRDLAALQWARRRLLALSRSFRPDVVYSAQQVWDLRLATPLARSLARPQVIHLHYNVGPALGSGVVEKLRQARMVLAVSEFIRADAIAHGVPVGRVHALYNSVIVPDELSPNARIEVRRALRHELGAPEDALFVGMTARLSPSKGQEDLVRAMLPLLKDDRRVHLLLAGSEFPARNGMTERIRQIAQVNGVAAQVHLLGQRSDVPRILDAIDVFAHPTRQDPCPLAVLEAAAHGLPIVAWREGGTAALVSDQETGFLVEPMDLDGLTRALRTLISDHQLRTMIGRQACERAASQFSPGVAAASFVSRLREATRDPSRDPYGVQRQGGVVAAVGD